MRRRSNAFTLIELMVTIAIIGVLATMAAVNFTNVRKNSRDTRRKSDANAYADAMQAYKIKNGSFFVVYKDSTSSSWTCDLSNDTYEATEKNLANYSQHINDLHDATGNGCTGAYGRSGGPITSDSSGVAGRFASHSIAAALKSGGYLGSGDNALVNPNNVFLSHYLFRCDSQGVITYGKNDQHFSIAVALENHPATGTPEQINGSMYCAADHGKTATADTSRYYQVNSSLFYLAGDGAVPDPLP